MPYTSQTKVDAAIIERVLESAAQSRKLYGRDRLMILEVGTFYGDSSREIKRWCDERGEKLEFWGIDAGWHPNFKPGGTPPVPFDGANMVYGDSAEVYHQIPEGLDVALIDGCHCVNHVILDTIHFGEKVIPGGFMIFHDTAPHIQKTMRDPHGPDHPDFFNSVNDAHFKMGFPNSDWLLFIKGHDPEAPWGGTTAYQKRTP